MFVLVATVFGLRQDVGASVDQVLHAAVCAAVDGRHEGRAPVERRHVRLGAGGHQQLHRRQPTGVAGVVEWRPAQLVPRVHVSTVSSQRDATHTSMHARPHIRTHKHTHAHTRTRTQALELITFSLKSFRNSLEIS